MSHSLAVTKRVTVGMILVLGALFFQAGIASAQTPQQQLAEVKAQLEQLSAQFNTPTQQVLGVATTSTDVIPTCTVTTDKDSYVLGETIVVSWTTTKAKTVFFQRDAVKDNLAYPTEKLKKNGSIAIDATVTGNPVIEIAITSKTQDTAVCSKTISISKKGSGEDKEVKKLRKQLEQVQKQISSIEEKINSLQIKQGSLSVKSIELKNKIAELTGETNGNLQLEQGDVDGNFDSDSSVLSFNFEFEITPDDTDAVILDELMHIEKKTDLMTGAQGIFYKIVDGKGNVVKDNLVATTLDSSADKDVNQQYFILDETETENFDIRIEFQPSVAGTYYAEIVSIGWQNGFGQPVRDLNLSEAKAFRTPTVKVSAVKA